MAPAAARLREGRGENHERRNARQRKKYRVGASEGDWPFRRDREGRKREITGHSERAIWWVVRRRGRGNGKVGASWRCWRREGEERGGMRASCPAKRLAERGREKEATVWNERDGGGRERDELLEGGNRGGQRGRLDRKGGRGKGYVMPPGPDTVLHAGGEEREFARGHLPLLMGVQFSFSLSSTSFRIIFFCTDRMLKEMRNAFSEPIL